MERGFVFKPSGMASLHKGWLLGCPQRREGAGQGAPDDTRADSLAAP